MSTRPGTRALAAAATLESLKKEAKRWLKALREGDGAARERLLRVLPNAGAELALREVQHALALEHGLASWAALKGALADRALARRSPSERADDFLRHAIDRAGAPLAAHILRKHPDVARFSLHTAAVSGDLVAGGAERWRSSEAWPANGMLDYLIGNAVSRNHLKRTRWLLEHGAHATAKHFYNKRNLHTEAVLGGFTELAQLLLDFGARLERLDDVHAFQAACMSTDRDAARRLLAAHPEYRHFPGPMYQAAGRDRVDVAELLLELGMSPDVEHGGWVALHSTAHSNSVCVAKLLIQRGATIDIRENKYHSTPLGHAVWAGNQDMVDVLSAVSRDLVALARAGKLERLSALLDEDPSLAKAMRDGRTALYFLSAPEERAVEIAELLLARGADPKHKDAEGLTAADAAAKSGLEELAALLHDAQSPGQEVGT